MLPHHHQQQQTPPSSRQQQTIGNNNQRPIYRIADWWWNDHLKQHHHMQTIFARQPALAFQDSLPSDEVSNHLTSDGTSDENRHHQNNDNDDEEENKLFKDCLHQQFIPPDRPRVLETSAQFHVPAVHVPVDSTPTPQSSASTSKIEEKSFNAERLWEGHVTAMTFGQSTPSDVSLSQNNESSSINKHNRNNKKQELYYSTTTASMSMPPKTTNKSTLSLGSMILVANNTNEQWVAVTTPAASSTANFTEDYASVDHGNNNKDNKEALNMNIINNNTTGSSTMMKDQRQSTQVYQREPTTSSSSTSNNITPKSSSNNNISQFPNVFANITQYFALTQEILGEHNRRINSIQLQQEDDSSALTPARQENNTSKVSINEEFTEIPSFPSKTNLDVSAETSGQASPFTNMATPRPDTISINFNTTATGNNTNNRNQIHPQSASVQTTTTSATTTNADIVVSAQSTTDNNDANQNENDDEDVDVMNSQWSACSEAGDSECEQSCAEAVEHWLRQNNKNNNNHNNNSAQQQQTSSSVVEGVNKNVKTSVVPTVDGIPLSQLKSEVYFKSVTSKNTANPLGLRHNQFASGSTIIYEDIASSIGSHHSPSPSPFQQLAKNSTTEGRKKRSVGGSNKSSSSCSSSVVGNNNVDAAPHKENHDGTTITMSNDNDHNSGSEEQQQQPEEKTPLEKKREQKLRIKHSYDGTHNNNHTSASTTLPKITKSAIATTTQHHQHNNDDDTTNTNNNNNNNTGPSIMDLVGSASSLKSAMKFALRSVARSALEEWVGVLPALVLLPHGDRTRYYYSNSGSLVRSADESAAATTEGNFSDMPTGRVVNRNVVDFSSMLSNASGY